MKFLVRSAAIGVSVAACGGSVAIPPPASTGGSTSSHSTTASSTASGHGGHAGAGSSGNGGALSGCTSDADCLAGETCNTSAGACVGTVAETCHQCACIDVLSMGGCANVCDMAENGTTIPNFCNGVPALPQCAKCLAGSCGGIPDPPDPNKPSACM
jgi:hypothetical protein